MKAGAFAAALSFFGRRTTSAGRGRRIAASAFTVAALVVSSLLATTTAAQAADPSVQIRICSSGAGAGYRLGGYNQDNRYAQTSWFTVDTNQCSLVPGPNGWWWRISAPAGPSLDWSAGSLGSGFEVLNISGYQDGQTITFTKRYIVF
ncbi:hypothetical protein ACFYXF_51540 [Streptomyces sp. NPDC002680]|uniref:hypothetical protein n=1 Tax=Streptomyces sp. NPDC002680 TaxID=3364659 RepID=UPI00367A226F